MDVARLLLTSAVAVVVLVGEGSLSDPSDIAEFEAGLREFARERYGSVLAGIADTGDLPEDELVGAINAYKASLGDGEPTGEMSVEA